MWNIGMMAWRIGGIIAIDEQIDWIRAAGFEGVGFHACAGVSGQWEGIDPSRTDKRSRARLRRDLESFSMREVHAPTAIQLKEGSLAESTNTLMPILEFAGEIGATIVTAHARPPVTKAGADLAEWRDNLDRLNFAAARAGVTVGLEVTEGFEWVANLGLPNIGVTLDVGHMYHNGAKPLQPYGALGEIVRRLGPALAHLHIHDYDGIVDHLELGKGRVDFDELLKALKDTGYRGGMCLELNPDRCALEGILRSRAWLQERTAVGARARHDGARAQF